jgi:uncharacterized SAM-binding protein YcdF (DUF218 family)
LGLLNRRQVLVPTLRGWLLILLSIGLLGIIAARKAYPFLSINDSLPGGVLVVEGWAPDYVMTQAVAESQSNHYDRVFVTGIPLEHGAPLSEFNTYAELGAAVLVKLGLSTNLVQAVPTPNVKQDRTYTSAAVLKAWLDEHGMKVTRINVFTVGPHARRSRLLYQKAMGKEAAIGVISAPVREYDPGRWWRSSPGFRDVTGEATAYLYVRLFFRAPAKP